MISSTERTQIVDYSVPYKHVLGCDERQILKLKHGHVAVFRTTEHILSHTGSKKNFYSYTVIYFDEKTDRMYSAEGTNSVDESTSYGVYPPYFRINEPYVSYANLGDSAIDSIEVFDINENLGDL